MRRLAPAAIGLFVSAGIGLTLMINYLLFHSLTEIFSIAIAFAIFIIAWNLRQSIQNGYLMLVGIAYLFIGFLDMLHMLSYKGMGVFPSDEGTVAVQLWIAARYMEAATLLAAPFFIRRKLKPYLVFQAYMLVTALVIASIFVVRIFPACYVTGIGLTSFKIISEYVICAILAAALYALFRVRREFDDNVLRLLTLSIISTIAMEVSFTLYESLYGVSNIIGHFLKIISFYFIYRALVVTGLQHPVEVLFKDLKEREETLKRERDFISAVIETMGSVMVVLDSAGRIVRFNRSAELLTGLWSDEVIGKDFIEALIVPEERAQALAGIQHLQHSGLLCCYDNHVLTKNGRRRLVSWTHTGVIGDDGRLEYIISSGNDITERRAAEIALRDKEEQVRLLLNSTAEAIYGMDTSGRCTFLNPSAVRMLGFQSADALEGKPIHQIIHHTRRDGSPYPDEECRGFSSVITGVGVHVEDEVFWRADGTSIPVEYWSYPVFREGRVIGAVVTFIDITERLKGEEEKKLNEKRLEALVCLTDMTALPVQDISGFVIENAITLTQSRYGFIGMLDESRSSIQLVSFSKDVMSECKAGNHDFKFNLEGAGAWAESIKAGKPYIINDYGSRIGKDGGIPAGHVPITRLLTVPIYLDNTIAGMAAVANKNSQYDDNDVRQLSLLIDGMAHHIERKRFVDELEKARFAAVAASRAKSEFLANMSHELRTPMNGIMGMTDLALYTELTDEQREYLEVVRQSADSLQVVLNDILDFSKVEAGKLDLDIADFDMQALLDSTCKTLSVLAFRKGIEFNCHIKHGTMFFFRGDAGRLRQIIMNLGGNAIKFTERGEVSIIAEEVPCVLQNDMVTIKFTVKDTGIGIPREKLAFIFESFSQVDASTSRKYGGTGLGLAICKQLAGLMGGEVGVESEPGMGSAFWFTVCLHPGEERPAGDVPDLDGLKVLVVDDNATNRAILVDALSIHNAEVFEAPDARTGLIMLNDAAHESAPYGFVLLDYNMPGMNGIEMLGIIRSTPALSDTPVAMLTSGAMVEEMSEVEKLNIAFYLSKPVSIGSLMDSVMVSTGRITSAMRVQKQLNHAGKHLNILLAEDNPVNQKLFMRILQKSGHEVLAVSNGSEALDALGRHDFDLVIMDVQMPVMDGLDASRAIRSGANPRIPSDIPIVALTARAMKHDRDECLAAGMNDFVSKPTKAKELLEVISRLSAIHWKRETPADPGNVIDRGRALELLGGDEELLDSIQEDYLAAMPEMFENLREAVAKSDMAAVRHIAHSFKSSSASIGAFSLGDTARLIENAAFEGSMPLVSGQFRRFENEYQNALRALERRRA